MTWQRARWVVGSGLAHAGLMGALLLLATTAERPPATFQARLIREAEPPAPRAAPTSPAPHAPDPIVQRPARTGPEPTKRQPPRRLTGSPSPATPASLERESPPPPASPVQPPPSPAAVPETAPATSAEPGGASAATAGAGRPAGGSGGGGGDAGTAGSGGGGAGVTKGAAEPAGGIGVFSRVGVGRGAAGAGDGVGEGSGSGRGPGHGGGEGSGAGTGAGHGGGPGAGVADLLRAMRRQIEQAKVYPEAARRREAEGTVELRFRIAPDGSVARVEIVHSSGHAILDESAILTIRRAAPYPVLAGWIQIPLAYRLER